MKRTARRRLVLIIALVLVLAGAAVWHLGTQEEYVSGTPAPADPGLIARGEYLVRAGDCAACHTARGGPRFAGGRAIATPFGSIYSSNITPDPETGLGLWSADDLWRALHNGRSREGSFLYPAFPYPNYTRITRADSDAIYAYLRSLQPVRLANRPTGLRFPYRFRPFLVVWRALYFVPGTWQARPDRSAAWNRGAYLVEGLGHCDACHANRNVLGATESGVGLSGGQIPVMNWYAPSLLGASEAGLKDWPSDDLISLLHKGVSARAAVFGPMAEVVEESLQYLSPEDMDALSVYLKDSDRGPATAKPQAVSPASAVAPSTSPAAAPAADADAAQTLALAQWDAAAGQKLYEDHCQDCHQASGQGVPGIYPPLAGNRAILMASPVNPIRVVMLGGFGPVTADNPRPYGMPPFSQELSGSQIAAVVSYIRNAWGNQASRVTSADVEGYRDAPPD